MLHQAIHATCVNPPELTPREAKLNRRSGNVLGFALLFLGALGTVGSIFLYPLVGLLLGAFASVLTLLFVVVGVLGAIVIGWSENQPR